MRQVDPIAVLRKLSRQHGSQKELAAALGVSQSYITDLINGRREASDRVLDKIGLRRVVVSK